MTNQETMKFWKMVHGNGSIRLRIQKGMVYGIEFICNGKPDSKIYSPLSDDGHKGLGYGEIDFHEAEELLHRFTSGVLSKKNSNSKISSLMMLGEE